MSTPKKPEYRHIGKYVPRKDAREIVTGKCIYLDDYKMKGMLHAKLMPSPYAHAMIKDIDTSKAEALPGVYAVVTYKNQPDFSKEFLQGLPPVKKVCDQHLRYVGDCVALVAAETEELCEEAIRLIKVDYEVLPGNVLRIYSSLDAPQRVTQALVEGGVALQGIESRGANLEDYFLAMIGGVRHA